MTIWPAIACGQVIRTAMQALAANTLLVYWLNRTFATGLRISLVDP